MIVYFLANRAGFSFAVFIVDEHVESFVFGFDQVVLARGQEIVVEVVECPDCVISHCNTGGQKSVGVNRLRSWNVQLKLKSSQTTFFTKCVCWLIYPISYLDILWIKFIHWLPGCQSKSVLNNTVPGELEIISAVLELFSADFWLQNV